MEYYDIKKLDQYTDALKVVRPTAEQSLLTKIYLNSLYGKLISSIHFINGKEKNMDREYIVLHGEREKGFITLGIIFKSHIEGVLKSDDGTAIILIDCGITQYCTDSYEDIVKQLL